MDGQSVLRKGWEASFPGAVLLATSETIQASVADGIALNRPENLGLLTEGLR
jgi:hypothetical protein